MWLLEYFISLEKMFSRDKIFLLISVGLRMTQRIPNPFNDNDSE